MEVSRRFLMKVDFYATFITSGMPIQNDPLSKGNLYIQFTIKYPETIAEEHKEVWDVKEYILNVFVDDS